MRAPDHSEVGVNTLPFPAFPQDGCAVRTAASRARVQSCNNRHNFIEWSVRVSRAKVRKVRLDINPTCSKQIYLRARAHKSRSSRVAGEIKGKCVVIKFRKKSEIAALELLAKHLGAGKQAESNGGRPA